MNNIGIIAEYNPFHNGHKYQLEKLKEITKYDNAICVISGNFIQRGLPAIYDKWTRTKMALEAGFDLVVELPTYYALNSAEKFALGGVNILNNLGIINNICFGVENNDLDSLNDIANILVEEPKEYIKILKEELQKGISYAKSRENAIIKYTNNKKYGNILNSPNNILGIEYLKALKKLKSNMAPLLIKRHISNYNDIIIESNICSATSIREVMENKDIKNKEEILSKVVPNYTYNIMQNNNITTLKDFEKEIIYSIRKMSIEELSQILEVNEGIQTRLKKYSFETNDIYQLVDLVKSKRFTQTKIQRILLHILLNMTENEFNYINKDNEYIRVLGFNKNGKKLLKYIAQNTTIPIITSVNKYIKQYGKNSLLEKDILSSNIYLGKYNIDYTQKIIEI